ncbi:TfoX/Sxy family protein [Amycolatopsis thermophila]|uniref:TfoX/Sxy family transcriptional regulator of competence genes n=1 Tax=Amycolatopsis thermophila TaxID=206084 RepID=A0ABU0F1P9_9PSEU|nr:TfoX/Sxy family protein [Amycolatopsis thermophila]MDQ0381010.1 TfoX/Sxy family transcriptional regulator of competence genes [Amycolatopsis thermophila]
MAYDRELAERVRELLAGEDGMTEKPMFGGLAFLVHGNMSVAASSQGGLLVRVEPADGDALIGDHVHPMVMRGREMTGWLLVDAPAVRTRRQLEQWVARGVSYARSLPAKAR